MKLGVLSYDIKHFANCNTETFWVVTSLADSTNTTLNVGAIQRKLFGFCGFNR